MGFTLLALLAIPAAALNLPSIFGDHMVLQAGKDIQVWGWAQPGEDIRVQLGWHRERTTADENGRWQVAFPPREAGDNLKLKVKGDEERIVFEDVLIGEVWVCSGQSNMQWSVERSNNPNLEIEQAHYPEMRLFSVPRKVTAEPQQDCEGEWVICSPETVAGFSAVGYFFGRDLHEDLDVPVGMIHSSWGGTPAESWTTLESVKADPIIAPVLEHWENETKKHEDALAAWRDGGEQGDRPRSGTRNEWRPAGLYNAMIAPIVPYTIQGAIWYQGESNASRAYQYRTLFPTMIQDWHEAWDQGPFPFLFVQLANFTPVLDDPADSDWAELREAQHMTLDKVENTGEAVAIDLGVPRDIHPRNKQEVARRLALSALANTYSQDIPYSGPVYTSMEKNGSEIILHFDHTDYGLQAYDQGRLEGFAIAGADANFVWADARIEGDTVIVSSDKVPDPAAVRYGWANNPVCNLYNGVGLPASPFRTDNWPGITLDNRVR
jgi:sialate O-acetylesterase